MTFQSQTFQPGIFEPWGWKVHGWKVWGWNVISLEGLRIFQPRTFQPWTFHPHGSKIHGWKVRGWKVHVWKVWGWKVWGWSLGVWGWDVFQPSKQVHVFSNPLQSPLMQPEGLIHWLHVKPVQALLHKHLSGSSQTPCIHSSVQIAKRKGRYMKIISGTYHINIKTHIAFFQKTSLKLHWFQYWN